MVDKPAPFRPISPGEILQEELEARNWTQAHLADIIGRPLQVVNEIIAGKKAITATTATELANAFGTSAEFWLNLESAYRLDLVRQGKDGGEDIARKASLYSRVPVKDLIKKGWISKTANLNRIERDVCKLLEIRRIDERPQLRVAARKSDPYEELTPAQVAWVCRARQMARGMDVEQFDKRRFESEIAKLPRLSVEGDDVSLVPKELASLGIRLVWVEHLPQTYIDGAAFWLDSTSPVVALSLRYDRIDYFWFTLMHELAHVKQNGKHEGHLDNNLVGPSAEASSDKPRGEQEADEMASEWLVPAQKLRRFVQQTRPYYSKAAIVGFAGDLHVHPGIVVGRLQHDGEINYSHSRAMLVKVRDRLCSSLCRG